MISDLGRNHRDNTDDLSLRRKPVGIEIIGRPRKIFAHTVAAKAKEMLNFLGFNLRGKPAGRG